MRAEDRKLVWAGIIVLAIIAIELACLVLIGPAQGGTACGKHDTFQCNLPLWDSAAFWTAIFTLFLTISTAMLWWQTRRLAKGAEIQNKNMTASIAVAEAANKIAQAGVVTSRRAWLSLENANLQHPTAFTGEGISWKAGITIKNLGQTPATAVFVHFESYFAEGNSENFTTAEMRFKTRLRNHPVQLGDTLFPGDILVETLRWIDGHEKINNAIRGGPAEQRHINFHVFIGVSYRVAGDVEARITYRPFSMVNMPIGTTIQPGMMQPLPRDAFLAGQVD